MVPQRIPAGLLVTLPVPVPATTTVTVFAVEGANVAATEVLSLRVRLQDPVPLQAPDQPAKVEPAAGAAVNVTAVPLLNMALQVVPQLIPAGMLVTTPVPVPARVTVRVSVVTDWLNEAVTELLALIVTLQAPVPLHAPDQPLKVEPVAGVDRVPEVADDPDVREVLERGCGDPTFTGPGFELLDAAAAAARVVVQCLLGGDGYPARDFDLVTLNFRDRTSARPSAVYSALPIHPKCSICNG